MEKNINNDLLTTKQAMEYLKCSDVFIWKKRKEGLIKSVKIGAKLLILKSSIDSLLKPGEN